MKSACKKTFGKPALVEQGYAPLEFTKKDITQIKHYLSKYGEDAVIRFLRWLPENWDGITERYPFLCERGFPPNPGVLGRIPTLFQCKVKARIPDHPRKTKRKMSSEYNAAVAKDAPKHGWR